MSLFTGLSFPPSTTGFPFFFFFFERVDHCGGGILLPFFFSTDGLFTPPTPRQFPPPPFQTSPAFFLGEKIIQTKGTAPLLPPNVPLLEFSPPPQKPSGKVFRIFYALSSGGTRLFVCNVSHWDTYFLFFFSFSFSYEFFGVFFPCKQDIPGVLCVSGESPQPPTEFSPPPRWSLRWFFFLLMISGRVSCLCPFSCSGITLFQGLSHPFCSFFYEIFFFCGVSFFFERLNEFIFFFFFFPFFSFPPSLFRSSWSLEFHMKSAPLLLRLAVFPFFFPVLGDLSPFVFFLWRTALFLGCSCFLFFLCRGRRAGSFFFLGGAFPRYLSFPPSQTTSPP